MRQAEQIICKGCGQPVRGSYIQTMQAYWHPEHFLCTACHRPIGEDKYYIHNDAPYHMSCYQQQIAPHCVYCGKPLLGRYLIDRWGSKFCTEHQQQYPPCAFCGRLVPPAQQTHSEGGICCPICHTSAIETIAEARPLYQQVVRWISSQGLAYNNTPLSLELCDRAKLTSLFQGRGPLHSMGATLSDTYQIAGQIVDVKLKGVAILQGLPAALFQGIVAHELGHVWLLVHQVRGLSSQAEEGFCEVLSHRYYQMLNTPESQFHATAIEENKDPIYGAGFRAIQRIVEQRGFEYVRDTLLRTKRMPAG